MALAAPLVSHGELRGFVGLGRRASGSRYSRGEEQFLAAVAAQLALVLERQGEDSIGRYRLIRRLGVGGMAEVFLARQIGLAGFERKVAIKRALPRFMEDPKFVTMFIEEAKLVAGLHHPNIVQTHEVDRDGDSYFIAMEYVEGSPLRVLLRGCRDLKRRPSLGITLAVGEALLSALAYAHARLDDDGQPLGIVHRDVSPANLLVSVLGEVKLVDFGVARSAARTHVTQAGVIKGTLAYMAPEQSQGRSVDGRTDLFGAGAILYECLQGQAPYPDGPPRVAPARPPELDAEVPPALAEVVQRALAFDMSKRFADAQEMRLALLAACQVPPAPLAEIARWRREVAERTADAVPLHEANTAVGPKVD
jgi:serine/threonine-protein kinase